ncbi:Ig-like domain-containing protein [Rhizobium alvei]|uniref:Ig-like domain-containing protein n=1 Tax=Rhizobium alvei TaxID=1132659 RepID=A0ABT8YGU3_9HYPH|nr:Ig-like domain-containing protein [Rhizobium alvei]MDO6962834.1 Ig-like domain-containing protein [Rhizobium alvei]
MTAPTANNIIVTLNPDDGDPNNLPEYASFTLSEELIGFADADGDYLKWVFFGDNILTPFERLLVSGDQLKSAGYIRVVFYDSSNEAGFFDIITDYLNIAPEGIDGNVSLFEDQGYTFSVSDFGFSDANGEDLKEIIITSLPTGGLTLDGGAVSAGQHIAADNISKLVWTPNTNENGDELASFTFQVVDDGGTWNGGVDTDQTANRLVLNVTAVNDAPTGYDQTFSIAESGTYTFSVADFPIDDLEGNALLGISITGISDKGYLTLDGNAVSAGQFVDVDQLDLLVWHGDANTFGDNIAAFDFKVIDDGSTDNNGSNTSANLYSVNFDVAGTPDKPLTSDRSIDLVEDQTFRLYQGLFPFGDRDGDSLSAVIFTDIPTGARMFLDGVRVEEGETVDIDDIRAGKVTFVGPANFSGSDPAVLKFRVVDNSASELQSDEASISITYAPMEDRPIAASDKFAINEGAAALLDVLANDGDPDGDTLSIDSAEVFAGDAAVSIVDGKLQVNWTGRDLKAGEKETVIVNYSASDGSNLDEALAVITVQGVTTMGAEIKGNAKGNTLNGTALGEQILGLGGADKLSAGGGDDFLFGGTGGDRLTGGTGIDTFVFEAKCSKDLITDFGSTGEADVIDLSAIDEIANYRDLIRNHLTYKDGDAIITISKTDVITLDDVQKGELFAANFLL